MPPSGPRSRAPPSNGARKNSKGGATARNEAFESIFGRPAGGHHMGPGGPGQPPAGPSYGYANHPPGGSGVNYLNPAQPSFPPSQPQTFVTPPPRGPSGPYPGPQPQVLHPPPRSETSLHPQRIPQDVGASRYGPPAPQAYYNGGAYGSQPEPPNRRASLAPSTYSNSGSSYYSPNPEGSSPMIQWADHLPGGHQSLPDPYAGTSRSSSHTSQGSGGRSTSGPYYAGATSRTPGYADSSYDSASSPASMVFPRRPSDSQQTSASSLSLGSTNTAPSRNSASPSASLHSQSAARSPASRLNSTTTPSAEQLPTVPDHLGSFANLSFDGAGGGPLDSVPGIPKKGELSDFGRIQFPTSDDQYGTARASSSQRSHDPRQSSVSSHASTATHRRMASDSSIASSGYTMTSLNRGNYMTPMSQFEQSIPERPGSFIDSPNGSETFTLPNRNSDRKSIDSTQSLPLPLDSAPSFDHRATSFSGGSTSRAEAKAAIRSGSIGHSLVRRTTGSGPPTSFAFPTPLSSQRSLHGQLARSSSSARAQTLQAMSYVYPALLSRVAEAFKQVILLSELIKDGITYKDAFDGRTAVTIIGEVIKTSDRNLALLLGRALDSQKFFHDVTYDHRLRDNPTEIYQFKERLTAPYMSNSINDSPSSGHVALGRAPSTSSATHSMSRPSLGAYPSDSGSVQTLDNSATTSNNATPATSTTNLSRATSSPVQLTKIQSAGSIPTGLNVDDDSWSDDDLPVGVFTLLTDCYSPTCSTTQLCYSINCPRRLEQMKRQGMKPTGLNRKVSTESLKDVKETGTLWIHSVSQEILDSVDDNEKKRQEAINEVIYTERDFVRDLEYLRDSWVKPLRTQEIVPQNKRDDFVRQVFWNVHDVLTVNHVLAERLTKRQKQQPVVKAIGDIFLERVPLFEPFVVYGAHQLFGKYEFEKEKGSNPAFQKFVDETERKPESRKLELNGYLTKPTTRLGRYPLLLGAVLKYTADDDPDKKDLEDAIKMIRDFLTKVNAESGKAENIFELAQLEQQLVFRPHETIDLRLRDRSRELVHKGPLKRRGGNREEIADLLGFLFDHAFLLVKPKYVSKAEQYKVYRRPIPLELLVISTPDDHYNLSKMSAGRNRLITRPSAGSKSSSLTHVPPKPESKHGFSITIIHLGKKGYSMQLWVDTWVSRKKWLESIDKQQHILRERSCVFVPETITDGYFGGLKKLNCISPYDNGNRMIYGTDEGVYFSNLRDDKLREPVKVINLLDVTQVDVIEDFQLLIVLHERSVTTFPLDCLDPNDPNAALKRGKRISSHTSFFKSGACLGKLLVAVVKSSTLSSTIKVLEPVDQTMRGKKPQTSFMKRLNGQNEALKLFKEFYIPTESSSVHFLKTKLCVGCTRGFEIVDLETLDMQGLLDPSDASLDFVLKRDNVRPIAIYRIEEDFLLCYDEFAFYVNKNGWRSRPKWAIIWEGMPSAFALHYPYVLAFEPTFVEIHHVESGHLVQIIPRNHIHCLFADTPPSRVNAPPPGRQLMYPPNGGVFRNPAPGHPGGQNPYQNQFPNQGGYAPPGQMRPPMPGNGAGYGSMPPPGAPGPGGMMPRFARPQIIFTSDDGHVQFLKLPLGGSSGGGGGGAHPLPAGKAGSVHGHRPSH